MDGQTIGKAIIAVTLHEPRKLRPEKIVERRANGVPTMYGRKAPGVRRSTSPQRTDRRGRNGLINEEPMVIKLWCAGESMLILYRLPLEPLIMSVRSVAIAERSL